MRHSTQIKKLTVAVAVAMSGALVALSCLDRGVWPLDDTGSSRYKFQSEGLITGPDIRMCPSPCCGGWIIEIDSAYYTFSQVPENSGIDFDHEKFPLPVKLDWELDSTIACNHIIINRIRVSP